MARTRRLSTDNLISSVKRRANEEMDLGVVPHILSFHEDYLMDTVSLPIDGSTSRYKIPNRAIGNKVRDVRYRDGNGNLSEMTRVQKEDEMYYQFNGGGAVTMGLRPFLIEADEIVIPEGSNPNIGGFIEIVYYLRPNEIVSEDRTCKITAIDTNTKTITIDSFPDAFDGETVFDITSSKSPYKLVTMDITPTTLPDVSNLFFVVDELPSGLSVGDIVALSEETIIPQIPLELQSMLAQRIAIRCLEALGDTAGLTNAMAKLQEMEFKTGSLIDNRVEGSPWKVVNFHSFLRSRRKWNSR
jgi:hypothetical protein